MDHSPKDKSQPDSGSHSDIDRPLLDHTSSIFRPVNPWKMTLQQCIIARHSIDAICTSEDVQPGVPMYYPTWREESEDGQFLNEKKPGNHDRVTFGWRPTIIAFLIDWLPRRIFINLLFHLPSIYLSRYERMFSEAGESLVDMKQRALDESSRMQQPDAKTFVESTTVGGIPSPGLVSLFLDTVLVFTYIRRWMEVHSLRYLSAEEPALKTLESLMCFSYMVAIIAALYSPEIPRPNTGATWKYNVAMNTQGIHQPFIWSIWIQLSMGAVWTVWACTFLGLYLLQVFLRWHLPIYAGILPDLFTGITVHMIGGYIYMFGAFSTIFGGYYYRRQYKKWGECL